MDLRYWKCPEGHKSWQSYGRMCWCNECQKEYSWYAGQEIPAPDDGISDKEYPYDD